MFKLFHHNKQKASPVAPALQKAGEALKARLHRGTDWLNCKAQKMDRRQLRYLLFAFCVYWITASVYITLQAMHPKQPQPAFAVTPIATPRRLIEAPLQDQDSLTQKVLDRIELFSHYLDSLKAHERRTYDSILRARPGLIDSLALIEHYYSTFK